MEPTETTDTKNKIPEYKNIQNQLPIISEENSKRITALRFFLILLVLMNHNNETVLCFMHAGQAGEITNPTFWDIFRKAPLLYLSTGISGSVIPLFYLFTSYFQNVKDYSFKTVLKKKMSSLVFPYFGWFVLVLLLQIIPRIGVNIFFPSHVSNPRYIPFFTNWTFADWFKGIFGYNISDNGAPFLNAPYIVPFWFLRDLIILTLISPLLKFLVKKAPFLILSLLCINFFYFNRNFGIIFNQSVFFYIMGIYWACYRHIDIFALADKIRWWEVWPVHIVAWYLEKLHPSIATEQIVTMSSAAILLGLSKYMIAKPKIYGFLSYASSYIFFVFAIHRPLLMKYVNNAFHFVVRSDSLPAQYLQYFTVSLTTFTLGLLIAIGLKKVCPKLFGILNGGR